MRSVLIKVAKSHSNNRLFNLADPVLNRDNNLQPGVALRQALLEQGIQLDTADVGDPEKCEKIIVYDLHKENLQYVQQCVKNGWQKKLVLVLWEGPVVQPINWRLENHQLFDKIFTWDDDYVDNKKYFKLYYPQPELPFRAFEVPFSQKKLCTMITANKFYNQLGEIYSERVRAIKFFESKFPGDFDLYGIKWDKPVRRLHKWFPFLAPHYESYRGPVAEKGPVFSRYKFAVCYENTEGLRGYVTEKIFDCFRGGCIPIYLGAENIEDFVPTDTFIDKRKFASYDELLSFLQAITEKEYNQYMNNIGDYLKSDKFKLFSVDNFVSIMTKHLV